MHPETLHSPDLNPEWEVKILNLELVPQGSGNQGASNQSALFPGFHYQAVPAHPNEQAACPESFPICKRLSRFEHEGWAVHGKQRGCSCDHAPLEVSRHLAIHLVGL